MDNDRFPVKPTTARLRLYFVGLTFSLCGPFVYAPAVLIIRGSLSGFIVGVAFSVGAALLILPLVRAYRQYGSFTILVLTPRGIEIEGGLIPWEDVMRVGSATHRPRSTWPRFFGITLRDYTQFLNSLESHNPRRAAAIPRKMRWLQRQNGWDLHVSPLLLDRPLPDFVALVQNYRIRYRGDNNQEPEQM